MSRGCIVIWDKVIFLKSIVPETLKHSHQNLT